MVVSVVHFLLIASSCTCEVVSPMALELESKPEPEPEPEFEPEPVSEGEIEDDGSDSSRSMYEVQLVVCFPRGGRTGFFFLVKSSLDESLLIGEAL